jgi:hypothetical protein
MASKFSEVLGCRVITLPMTYIGLALRSSFKAHAVWNTIVEKMEQRLASQWEGAQYQ